MGMQKHYHFIFFTSHSFQLGVWTVHIFTGRSPSAGPLQLQGPWQRQCPQGTAHDCGNRRCPSLEQQFFGAMGFLEISPWFLQEHPLWYNEMLNLGLRPGQKPSDGVRNFDMNSDIGDTMVNMPPGTIQWSIQVPDRKIIWFINLLLVLRPICSKSIVPGSIFLQRVSSTKEATSNWSFFTSIFEGYMYPVRCFI